MRQVFNVKDFGAKGDGCSLDTAAIQAAIDAAAACKGQVLVGEGIYLTGSLFLKSGIDFHIARGGEIRGTQDESQYPMMPSRVAGVEMIWPAGVINIFDQEYVTISGKGLINGQGEFWWDKFWGPDGQGGMCRDYEARGLRWAVDYDCTRPRNVLVMNCRHIELSEFTCIRSGFWNVHICYCEHVHIDGLIISENYGPSTDGIDIDSSCHVLVENCVLSCNDDSICIKAGRDADGLRVDRVCQDVEIRACAMGAGSGITLGSETSGGIRDIYIHDCTYKNTGCGFRIKSSRTRGGILENIRVEYLTMGNVMYPFNFLLDWYPAYSYCKIPENYQGEIPQHWKTLTAPVPESMGIPTVRNVTIRNVVSSFDPDYEGISRAFDIMAFTEQPMENVIFEDVTIKAKEFGRIKAVKNLVFNNVSLSIEDEHKPENDFYAR